MSVRRVPALFAVLLASVAPTIGSAGQSPAGPIAISGDGGRFSLHARDVSLESLQAEIRARTGHGIVAPEDAGKRRLSVSFEDLPARQAVARIGSALGGLEPLRLSWAESAPGGAARPRSEFFLVRPGSRRQQLVDACGLAPPGNARRHLLELLRADGAAAVADVAAHAADRSRSDRERAASIKLLGTLGAAEATAPLAALLAADARPLPREAAAIALGLAARQEALPALRHALADPEPQVALSAAWALARLGDSSGVALALASLRTARGGAALRALEVISAAGDPRHLPALESLLAEAGGFERVRLKAAVADLRMARLDEAGRVAACESLLADGDFEMRRHGAAALARDGSPAARAALERVAADRTHAGVREAADAAAALRRALSPAPPVSIE